MGIVMMMTLPGLVVLLIAVIFVDQLLARAGRAGLLRGRGTSGRVSAMSFEMLHATLSPAKENELELRTASLMLRDEEGDGAPPRSVVDLCAGRAVIRPRPGPGLGSGRGHGGAAGAASPT